MANMLTHGHTPILSTSELAELGYKIAVAPIETLLVTARAMERLAHALLTEGRVDHLAPEQMATFSEIKSLLGLDEFLGLRERLSSDSQQV